MREHAFELFAHLLTVLLYTIGAAVTAVAGVVVEYHGVLYLLSGDYHLAAWVGIVGGILLLFSYLFVTDKLIPMLRPVAKPSDG